MSTIFSYVVSPITYLTSTVSSYFWQQAPDNQVIKHTAEEIQNQKNKLNINGEVLLTPINSEERVIVEKIYEEKPFEYNQASVNVTKEITISEEQRAIIKKQMKKTQFQVSMEDLIKRKDTLYHVEEEDKTQKQEINKNEPEYDNSFSSFFQLRWRAKEILEKVDNDWSDTDSESEETSKSPDCEEPQNYDTKDESDKFINKYYDDITENEDYNSEDENEDYNSEDNNEDENEDYNCEDNNEDDDNEYIEYLTECIN